MIYSIGMDFLTFAIKDHTNIKCSLLSRLTFKTETLEQGCPVFLFGIYLPA